MENVLILAAGEFNPKNVSAGMIADASLIPIRGKPAIGWIIDSVKKNGAKNIKIALREDNTQLSRILTCVYPDVEQVFLNNSVDITISLYKLLVSSNDDAPTQIVLGDTFIDEAFPKEPDVFLSSPTVKTSTQWCLVSKDKNGYIENIYNKEPDIPLNGKEVLVGYYKFSDTKLLKQIVKDVIDSNVLDFSEILRRYNQKIPVLIKNTNHWYDFGHISGAVQARLGLYNAREFNNLVVDSVRGTITKKSKKKQKLLDEANWYQSLPLELACFAPRVFNVTENADDASIEMELYGYQNLAEIFLYGSNNLEDWYNIIESLLKVHKLFEKYTEKADKQELIEIYQNKTNLRIQDIEQKNPAIYQMMQDEYITVNNVRYKNYPVIKNDLNNAILKLVEFDKRTIVHGDYCFSNILFDPMCYIFKFIDPRGRFKTQTIYGDPRYDIAKLRHSVVGLYDFIVAGLYKLSIDGKNYHFQISTPLLTEQLESFFDKLVMEYGYNCKDIKLIEGLLFLTMIPLHSDDINRQKAFYLTAIKKINEVLYDEQ